eukprot:13287461-Ditylum_brightwellii.AAC.1
MPLEQFTLLSKCSLTMVVRVNRPLYTMTMMTMKKVFKGAIAPTITKKITNPLHGAITYYLHVLPLNSTAFYPNCNTTCSYTSFHTAPI